MKVTQTRIHTKWHQIVTLDANCIQYSKDLTEMYFTLFGSYSHVGLEGQAQTGASMVKSVVPPPEDPHGP